MIEPYTDLEYYRKECELVYPDLEKNTRKCGAL
jgi:hypothetical protein